MCNNPQEKRVGEALIKSELAPIKSSERVSTTIRRHPAPDHRGHGCACKETRSRRKAS